MALPTHICSTAGRTCLSTVFAPSHRCVSPRTCFASCNERLQRRERCSSVQGPIQGPLQCKHVERTNAQQRSLHVPSSVNYQAPPAPVANELKIDVCGQTITLQTGEIGRQANGAVLAAFGETVIYCTACCSDQPGQSGLAPALAVTYGERFSAAGRTSGGYIKRDGAPRAGDILVSRLVDRPLRPMFDNDWTNDTQVLEWVLSYDTVHSPEALAIIAASAALIISDIPFRQPVAAVKVGLIDGEMIVNPTEQQMTQSKLDLTVAGTSDSILMIEGYANFVTEEEMLNAIQAAEAAIRDICRQLEAWAQQVGKPKRGSVPEQNDTAIASMLEMIRADMESAYQTGGKKERSDIIEAAKAQALATYLAAHPEGSEDALSSKEVKEALDAAEASFMRQKVMDTGVRQDGRGLQTMRGISCRANVLPRTHGSCLFTRGETQALCATTLGPKSVAQRIDKLRSTEEDSEGDRFYLQYFFPPSSVGETGRTGGPGRREVGHGKLAERALSPVVPEYEDFPYVVRVESTITESNGSSSMATVCGGCLSMLDAGVPLKRMIAGVAMGLVLEDDGRFVTLTDILGSEDALGDMDFKVAGDEEHITAFQMDIKKSGITVEILGQALAEARVARQHVLSKMKECSPAPRGALSPFAPHICFFQIDPSKKGSVIGQGGKNIKAIQQATGISEIQLGEDGTVELAGPSKECCQAAQELLELLAGDPEVGKILRSRKVTSVQSFGALVELAPGRSGLVHISQWDMTNITDMAAVVSAGDLVDVQVLGVSEGKVRLSRKTVLMKDLGIEPEPESEQGPRQTDSYRNGDSSEPMGAYMGRAPRSGEPRRGGGGGAPRYVKRRPKLAQ